MGVPVHGDSTIRWCGNVCLSILSGAFNEGGIAHWLQQVQQSWQQQGEPEQWASVLDMFGWQGRTPECDALMREGVAWSKAHGLKFRIMLMSHGTANIYFQLTQIANPIIPSNSEMIVCQSYADAIAPLQQHGFDISLQQLEQLQQR